MKRILVFGSLNIDLVQSVPRVPVPGETLKGGDLQIFVGGKGANQACAAARLGGEVRMAGSVGSDVFAGRILRELQAAGVDTSLVGESRGSSGSATIFVLPNGENMIAISPGANADVSVEFALEAIQALEAGDLLLCQLEIPMEAVAAAMCAAHERGVVTVLDPAPACRLPDRLWGAIDILTPNQTEAAILTSAARAPRDMAEAERCAQELRRRGAGTAIIKMGELGCFVASATGSEAIAGFRVLVWDTTAAGDMFNGALAAALARGAMLGDAARLANAAAALSVTRPGALNSAPSLAEVDRFLALQE